MQDAADRLQIGCRQPAREPNPSRPSTFSALARGRALSADGRGHLFHLLPSLHAKLLTSALRSPPLRGVGCFAVISAFRAPATTRAWASSRPVTGSERRS
jgi:hypothetical protein